MKKLMTKHFSKWASKQKVPSGELSKALDEVEKGLFEANLGGHIFKNASAFKGEVKGEAEERSFVINKMTGRFLFMALRKMKNQT